MSTAVIDIYAEWLPGEGFLIWADNEETHYYKTISLTKELKFCLFARHQPSFYGTFIDVSGHEDKIAVKLSPRTALDFFTEKTWADVITWRWSEEILTAGGRAQDQGNSGCRELAARFRQVAGRQKGLDYRLARRT